MNNEAHLLKAVILFEEGHSKRTRHLLTVHSLADMLSSSANVSVEERQQILAAAILHDIGIKPCKEKYGSAPQELQRKEAVALVHLFLEEADYAPSYEAEVLRLVQHHHCYKEPMDLRLRILIEADVIANFLEGEEVTPSMLKSIRSSYGKEIIHMMQLKGDQK